jgi:hypothetical protein
MAQHLAAAGLQHLMPPCWDSIEDYLAAQEQQHTGQQDLEQLQHPQQLERPGDVQQAQQQAQQQQQRQQQLQDEGAVHEHLLQLQLHDKGQLPSCAESAGCADMAAATGGLQRQDAATASSNGSGPVSGVSMTNCHRRE